MSPRGAEEAGGTGSPRFPGPETIRRILAHLGSRTEPYGFEPARSPPQAELDWLHAMSAGCAYLAGSPQGCTDRFSSNLAQSPVAVGDLHATLLQLCGVDRARSADPVQRSRLAPHWRRAPQRGARDPGLGAVPKPAANTEEGPKRIACRPLFKAVEALPPGSTARPFSTYWNWIEIPSVKFETGPGFRSRYHAWKW